MRYNHFLKFSIRLSVKRFLHVDLNLLGKIANKYMENLKQGSRDIKHRNGPKNLLVESIYYYYLVYNSIFFSEQPLNENYSTLDSHTNNVISRAVAYYSMKSRWLSKTVTRSIEIRDNVIGQVYSTRCHGFELDCKLN